MTRKTYLQERGVQPIPEPMRLDHLSKYLRNEIWNKLRNILLYSADGGFSERILGEFEGIPHDDVSEYGRMDTFKKVILKGEVDSVLYMIQIISNDDIYQERFGQSFVAEVKRLFEKHAAAYQLDTSEKPYQIVPRASKEAGEAVQQAVETVQEGGMDGASTHLRDAVEHINDDKYADSIADSIHAVESVARQIAPEAHQTLAPALESLEDSGLLKHEALKDAFKKLYKYTNDEQGIRHALLDKDAAAVGLDEALFMYGACASFAAYLTTKHRQQQRSAD